MHTFNSILVSFIFLINFAFADNSGLTNNYPSYHDGELIVPRVDTADQAGKFQDAILKFNQQTGTWSLQKFNTKTIDDIRILINDVEIVVTNTMPIQIFLNIDGDLFLGCSELGQISQNLKDNRFEVLIHDGPSNLLPDEGCGDATKPFKKVIPLSVYGLSAGTYEYSVNGGNVGTFTLSEDNVLQ